MKENRNMSKKNDKQSLCIQAYLCKYEPITMIFLHYTCMNLVNYLQIKLSDVNIAKIPLITCSGLSFLTDDVITLSDMTYDKILS